MALRRISRGAWCLLLFAACVVYAREDRLTTRENTYFEIVGPDSQSVSTVDELSEHLAETCLQLLATAKNPMPRRILVTLKGAESVDFEGDYLIRLEPRGFVTLHFRWEEDLDLENTVYALTRALLIQYVYSNYGSSAPPKMRAWPVSAIASIAYLRLRPAQTIGFLEEMKAERSPPTLEAILQAALMEVPVDRADRRGYWAWTVLKRQAGMPLSTFRAFLGEGLQGNEVLTRLEEVLGPAKEDAEEAEDFDIEAWWRAAMARELARRLEPFQGMDPSLRWLEALSDVSGLQEASDASPITLRSLWKLREEEAVREALSARVEILRLGLEQVNPAYFNSAQSLGALYETVLEGERSYEFIAALTRFLTDFEDMRRLHEEVTAALAE
ncbi:MAG: hypothetical protein ACOCVJ_03720 [Verrucomicrobiota bacterium]